MEKPLGGALEAEAQDSSKVGRGEAFLGLKSIQSSPEPEGRGREGGGEEGILDEDVSPQSSRWVEKAKHHFPDPHG